MKSYIIIHDKGSEILSKYFKNFEKIQIYLKNTISVSIDDILELSKLFKKYDFSNSIIIYGSNRRHFITLAILLSQKDKSFPNAYLHIDQHSDDYELVDGISSGNFLLYLKEMLNIDIYYIGFMRPDHKEIFSDYFVIDRKRENWKELYNFINNLDSNLYVSLDLDILKYNFCPNLFNKNINFLLDINELIEILKNIKNKVLTVDILGYLPMKDVSEMSVIKTYKKIINMFLNTS